ncbi:glucose dehydrogenase [FAD, quinone]-like [Tribolium madens]|uniref:glucose dehydrogenase [FAD, quinone]-like n=1 Tax=Tribolium madens TaxID=41895 RepID=UPI001CF75484|nr:glucose dehydrogenase [FAD, quinone]-like [Tribolium madens]
MSCCANAPYIGPPLDRTCYGGSFIFFMHLLNSLITKQCDVSEICERINPRPQPDSEYDFVVIGGGAGGSVVAARLSEIPDWKILLIEAGGDEPPGSQVPSMMNNYVGDSQMDWRYRTEPQEMACLGKPGRRCEWPRGRVLGGSGVIHGMMYMRGLPSDYNEWEARGNEGWGYEDVVEYFKKSEGNRDVGDGIEKKYHNIEGPMLVQRFPDRPEMAEDILRAGAELGYPVVEDLNGEQHWGFTIAQANIKNGSRLSSARAFLRPARDRPNLHIMLNSTATRIMIKSNDTGKSISAVEFTSNNQSFTVNVRREVVVSAGAINSPHLLLLSGIGPKEELDKVGIEQVHDLPGVGQNLKNHVSFALNYQLKKIKNYNDLNWDSVKEYLAGRKGPMSSTGVTQVAARISSEYADPDGRNPDLQFFFSGYLAQCSLSGGVKESEDPTKSQAAKSFTIRPTLLRPRSRGFIGLKSKDPKDSPLMQPNYLTDDEDVIRMVAGIRIAQDLANTNVLTRKYGIQMVENNYGDCSQNYTFDSDEFWACALRYDTGPENHQSCSCKMGPSSDPTAVVDPKLQVHGIEGLRIMDASVMPTVLSGNTHATVVMIAEKGSDYIKQKWLTQ